MMEALDILYPQTPTALNVEVIKQKGVKTMEAIGKRKLFMLACQYGLILIGAANVALSVWATLEPDATIYKNLRGMDPTARAYIKQILSSCGSSNYFATNSDSCEISTAALATMVKGEAVIAKFRPARLPSSSPEFHEPMADAEETTLGNEQSPAKQ